MQNTPKTAIVAAFSLLTLCSLSLGAPGTEDARAEPPRNLCPRVLQACSEAEEELILDERSFLSPSAVVEAKLRALSNRYGLPISATHVGTLAKPRFNGGN